MNIFWLMLFDSCLLTMALISLLWGMVGFYHLFNLLFYGFCLTQLNNLIERSNSRIRGTFIHQTLTLLGPLIPIIMIFWLNPEFISLISS